MSANSADFASSAPARPSSAGNRSTVSCSSAARCTADGKTSLELWPMLTSSLGCTSSPASVAITSFAFVFEEVPEPVWKTSIGNWSSSSPAAMRSPAAAMRCALSASRSPSSAFERAAAALSRPSQRATAAGIGSPETGKLAIALRVSPPHNSVGVEAVSVTLVKVARPPLLRRGGRQSLLVTSGPEKLVPGRELHARPAARLAGRALGYVDRLPTEVLDIRRTLRIEQRVEGLCRVTTDELPVPRVGQQKLDRLGRVLLVRA